MLYTGLEQEKQAFHSKERVKNIEGKKVKINWPKANSQEWKRLDEDIAELLKLMYVKRSFFVKVAVL